LALLTDDDQLADEEQAPELEVRVEALRAHLSETYRLHRRVIRHRRASVLRDDEASDLVPYEVRGRTRPRLLAVEAGEHQLAQALLLQWRTLIADHLLDTEANETQQTAYGMALAVLASRAGALFKDVLSALCWRVHHDGQAADQAGLTDQERGALSAPALVPGESDLLDAYTQEHADHADVSASKLLAKALLSVVRLGSRTVIFCGPGSLARQVADALREQAPVAVVGLHTTGIGADACEQALLAWRTARNTTQSQILVVDASAEDGLNLQLADTVVHVRLPWSPNRMEQRIGRVDRYRGVESLRQNRPAQQFRVGDREGDEAFCGAWARVLHEGYDLFTTSASTLQDTIADALPGVWRQALLDGPGRLTSLAPSIREELRQAKRDIDTMDMLESVHEASEQTRQTAAALDRLEQDWQRLRTDLVHYADRNNGGLGFRHGTRTVAGHQRDYFDIASSRPLIDPRRYKAVFNRSTALQAPGTRLFRAGNPFVDLLADIVFTDECGQATAFRRFDPACRGADEAYFGLEYLVEADISAALCRLEEVPEARRALRRQADRLMPPFTLKVWTRAGHPKALTDPAVCAWLNAPYGKDRGGKETKRDQNYNVTNQGQLLAVFGGWQEYQHAAQAAEDVARAHLFQATDLVSRCTTAQEQARQQLAVATVQAQARQAAGHLLGDTESYLLDVAVAGDLVEGLSRPSVRVVAATCIVRGGFRKAAHHE
jgi:ATP-dependent helicase HepA